MTIHLPENLESSILEAVHSGRFASIDEAMAEAARLLLRELKRRQPAPADAGDVTPDPFLGLMRDDAELMDEIVEDAMRNRERQPVASETPPAPAKRKPLWERAAELRKSIPAEEWDKLPTDGARQLDHYIYGSPKRTDA